MAENTQKKPQQEQEIDVPDFVPIKIAVKAFEKQVTKQVSEKTEQQLQSGRSPNEILADLLQTFGSPTQQSPQEKQAQTQELLGRITELSKTPVPTGQKAGLIPSLLKTGKLQRIPQTTQLGFDDATKVVGLQMKQEAAETGLPKQQLDFVRQLQQILASTPEGIEAGEVSKARGQATAQEAKEAAKTKRNFKIAQDKLKLTFKKFDEAVKETGKITGGTIEGAGRFGGTVTATLGALGANPKVAPFKGQMVEAATAIAKIAAPSAKVGPELIKVFSQTLPDIGFFTTSTSPEAREQTITSITNAFINYRATNPEDVGESDMTVFEDQIREMINGLADRGEDIFQSTATGIPSEQQQSPVGAAYYSPSQNKYYDAQGNEVQ